MMRLKKHFTRFSGVLCLFGVVAINPVFGANWKVLPGHVPGKLSQLKSVGRLAATNQMRLAIGVPFKDKSNIARRGHARDLRCRGNTWFIPYDTVQSKAAKFHHPSTFPVALPRWCIRLHGRDDASVLDPFMGTGTTLVAAELEGASGIGIEMDADYVDIARRRLAEAGQVQLNLAGV